MTDETKDVVEDKPKEPSARMKAMDEIADVAARQHETDTKEYEEQYGDEDSKRAVDAQPPLEPAPDTPAPRKFKGKVDGQEIEFDEAAVIEAGLKYLQKDRAADTRLEKASLLWKQAQQAAASKVLPEVPSDEDSDARAIARALQLGDEEEAAKAIEKMRGTGQREGLTPEEIEMRARRVFAEEAAKADGMRLMRDTFGDLAADPYLMGLAAAEEERLRAGGDTRSSKELWTSIATDLKLYSNWKTKGPGLEQRKEVKAAEKLPEPAGGRRPGPAEDKPKSTGEQIEEIRSRRQQGRKVNVRPTLGR